MLKKVRFVTIVTPILAATLHGCGGGDGDSGNKNVPVAPSTSASSSSSSSSFSTPEYIAVDEIVLHQQASTYWSTSKPIQLSNGNVLLSWYSVGEYRGKFNAQITTPEGELVGTEFEAVYSGNAPAFTPLSTGGFAGIWHAPNMIEAKIFDATGNIINDNVKLPFQTTRETSLTISALSNGNFLITWMDHLLNGASNSGLNAQIYNKDGIAIGSSFQLYKSDFDLDMVSVASLNENEFILTWAKNVHSASRQAPLYAQRYNILGHKVGPQIDVNTAENITNQSPQIIRLQDGGFAILWHEIDLSDTSSLDIPSKAKFQIFNISGEKSGSVISLGKVDEHQTSGNISQLENGDIIVSYLPGMGNGYVFHGRIKNIHLKTFSSDGRTLKKTSQVNNSSENDFSYFPLMTSLKDGGFVILWKEYANFISHSNHGPSENPPVYEKIKVKFVHSN